MQIGAALKRIKTASLGYASTARSPSLPNASRLCRGLRYCCTARKYTTLKRLMDY